jgi:Leucine-rich repeat (LRR) protein
VVVTTVHVYIQPHSHVLWLYTVTMSHGKSHITVAGGDSTRHHSITVQPAEQVHMKSLARRIHSLLSPSCQVSPLHSIPFACCSHKSIIFTHSMHSSQSIVLRVLLLLQAVCLRVFSFDSYDWKGDVTVVDLSHQDITEIDGSSIARLTEEQRQRVKVLYLDDNKLTSLPDTIGLLDNLEVLWLSDSKLKSLPDAIAKLENLKYLDVRVNKLATFPKEILELVSLEELNLYGNQLTSVPDTIGKLENLEVLHLGGNQLTTLPATIGNLKGLEELCLMGNSISQTGNAEGTTVGRNELSAMLGSRVVF